VDGPHLALLLPAATPPWGAVFTLVGAAALLVVLGFVLLLRSRR